MSLRKKFNTIRPKMYRLRLACVLLCLITTSCISKNKTHSPKQAADPNDTIQIVTYQDGKVLSTENYFASIDRSKTNLYTPDG